jgi:hypothetical protein
LAGRGAGATFGESADHRVFGLKYCLGPEFNPTHATSTESTLKEVESATRAMGLQIQVLNASTSREIDAAFATFVRERPDALFVGNDAFFNSRRVPGPKAAVDSRLRARGDPMGHAIDLRSRFTMHSDVSHDA